MAPPTKPDYLRVVPDAAGLNRNAVDEFCTCAHAAIAQSGRFAVALAGGNTPRGVYELLAKEPAGKLPWDKIHLFFGDERHVPPDHPDSNYRMVRETLVSKAPIPEANVHRVRAELDAPAAAAQYESALREFFQVQPGEWPRFDLILLGMGDDGHTASLFPGSPALNENARLVVANPTTQKGERITLTLPVLNRAANVVFLVSGAGKAQIMRDAFASANGMRFPARQVNPANGRLLWIADRAAASLLLS
ncbi:MAG: 6-phosphogluconolactonase [Acidobacteriia bacterium]|nr:6-phosphogluconolactonase [Terriglobia bacterium]